MPKSRAAATIGRSQPGRPPAPVGTPQQAEGPRTLQGALVLPIEQIVPDPGQPRTSQDARRLEELAASLREHGVLQPLLVREDGFLDDGRTRYMIVAGGRRYAAAQLAGLTRLPVVVRDTEGATLRVTQLVENAQRQDLAPLDEARAFQELMEAEGVSAEVLGARLHISGQRIRERLHLLSDQVIADAVERAQITPTIARDALRLPDEGRHDVRRRLESGERLSRADVKRVREHGAAAGVRNPRAKGGGRSARPTSASASAASPTPADDQAGLDPEPRARASTEQQPLPNEVARALAVLEQRAPNRGALWGGAPLDLPGSPAGHHC